MIETLGYTGPAFALDAYASTGKPQPAMYQFRTSCRLCGGPLARVLDLGATALANEYYPAERAGEKQDEFPLIIAQCASCQHVQLQCVVNPERLYSEYTYTSGVAASFRSHLESLATELHTAGHRTIVDIGSNDGTLLHYCRNLGMTGLGVDPARNLAAEASSRGNLTIPAFFNVETAREIRKTIGVPDVVTCLNAFAHTDDLAGIADGVRELIGDTGTFIFEVAYLLDLLKKNEIGSLYHEHVSHHGVGPLVDFFEDHGLKMFDVERLGTQGGSIRGYVARNRVSSGRIDRFLDEETDLVPGLLSSWTARVEAEREATMAELAPYLGKLAIFGAPARLTPYAAMLGLKRADVTCVFDDEPRKIGKLTPGLQWPIVPSAELMTRNPEAILISAWPYAKEIMARFPDYKGHWILPKREAKGVTTQ